MHETSPKETETSIHPVDTEPDKCLEKLPEDVKDGIDTEEAVLAMLHRYFPGTVEIVEDIEAGHVFNDNRSADSR